MAQTRAQTPPKTRDRPPRGHKYYVPAEYQHGPPPSPQEQHRSRLHQQQQQQAMMLQRQMAEAQYAQDVAGTRARAATVTAFDAYGRPYVASYDRGVPPGGHSPPSMSGPMSGHMSGHPTHQHHPAAALTSYHPSHPMHPQHHPQQYIPVVVAPPPPPQQQQLMAVPYHYAIDPRQHVIHERAYEHRYEEPPHEYYAAPYAMPVAHPPRAPPQQHQPSPPPQQPQPPYSTRSSWHVYQHPSSVKPHREPTAAQRQHQEALTQMMAANMAARHDKAADRKKQMAMTRLDSPPRLSVPPPLAKFDPAPPVPLMAPYVPQQQPQVVYVPSTAMRIAPRVISQPPLRLPSPDDIEQRRIVHNVSERRRRHTIREGFVALRDILPALHSDKHSKTDVLRRAIKYVGLLHNRRDSLQTGVDRMRREIAALKARKAGYDDYDVDMGEQVVMAIKAAPDAVSPSCASASSPITTVDVVTVTPESATTMHVASSCAADVRADAPAVSLARLSC